MIKKLSSKIVYQNPWMTVREDDVEFANGHQGIFGVVDKTDFALIIPFDGEKFHLVKQYRYATQQDSIEFPQGKHEAGSKISPVDLANAELKEETGLVAGKVEEIGFLHEAAGYSNQGFHIYLATELVQEESKLEVTEADLEHLTMTVEELETAMRRGKITDAPTVAAYGLLQITKPVKSA
ncbi:MAG TPA: NUDIX hydrolase [Patescibacteria group bacterium]